MSPNVINFSIALKKTQKSQNNYIHNERAPHSPLVPRFPCRLRTDTRHIYKARCNRGTRSVYQCVPLQHQLRFLSGIYDALTWCTAGGRERGRSGSHCVCNLVTQCVLVSVGKLVDLQKVLLIACGCLCACVHVCVKTDLLCLLDILFQDFFFFFLIYDEKYSSVVSSTFRNLYI